MDTTAANIQRNRRLRRRFLSALYSSRHSGDGWVTGRFIKDIVFRYLSRHDKAVGDDEVRGLLRDLVAKGYAEERDDRDYKHQAESIDYTSYRITGGGVSLIEESTGPDPDIEDDRISK